MKIYTNVYHDGELNSFSDRQEAIDDLIITTRTGYPYYVLKGGYRCTITVTVEDKTLSPALASVTFLDDEAKAWIDNDQREHEGDARHNRSCSVPSSIA